MTRRKKDRPLRWRPTLPLATPPPPGVLLKLQPAPPLEIDVPYVTFLPAWGYAVDHGLVSWAEAVNAIADHPIMECGWEGGPPTHAERLQAAADDLAEWEDVTVALEIDDPDRLLIGQQHAHQPLPPDHPLIQRMERIGRALADHLAAKAERAANPPQPRRARRPRRRRP